VSRLLNGLWHDLQMLDVRIAELNSEIREIAHNHPAAERLQQLRGVLANREEVHIQPFVAAKD
jgi:hypothetical protein